MTAATRRPITIFRPGVPPARKPEPQAASPEPVVTKPAPPPPAVASTPAPSPRPAPSLRIRQHVLAIPFEMRPLALQLGATWNPVSKTFVFRGETLPQTLSHFAAPPYSWERMKEDELNGLEPRANGPTRQIVLRDHQGTAADAMVAARKAKRSGFLLADDVGLGKTIEAWAGILRMDDLRTVLIVCPLAVVAHWRRTIQWMGDGGKRVVVINYERCRKLFDAPAAAATGGTAARKGKAKRAPAKKKKAVAGAGKAMGFDVVVWDESHRLRNPVSGRSKMSRKLNAASKFVLWLSATAGQNPLELSYLAPVLSESTGARISEMAEWEAWCRDNDLGVARGDYGAWKWRGDSDNDNERLAAEADLEKMRSMLFDGPVPVGIRRTPVDIAGWPPVTRVMLPVDLEGEDRDLYLEAWAEFRDALGLEYRGRDKQNAMVARLRFRQKASLLRTGSTFDLAADLLEQGRQVAVSVAFRETMDVLEAAFREAGHETSLIHGSMQGPEKERNRLDFQYGRSRVCIYTVEEGISLHEGEFEDGSHAPRANVVHDLRWSAISMKQVEGRTHRDGKNSPCYWMLGAGTVEEDIAETVAARMVSMSAMQGDKDTAEAVEALLRKAVSNAASRSWRHDGHGGRERAAVGWDSESTRTHMRSIAKAALLTLALAAPASAQEPPAEPTPREVLDSLYYTVALVMFCGIEVDPVLGEDLARTGLALEQSLGLDQAESDAAFQEVADGFIQYPPDCEDLDEVKTMLGAE